MKYLTLLEKKSLTKNRIIAYVFMAIILPIMICLFMSIPAFACTGVYVGKNVSADGTTILARSEDIHPTNIIATLCVNERIENQPGRVIKTHKGKFEWELPATTYKYLSNPFDTINNIGIWGQCCTNEYGLAVTGAVTGYSSPEILKLDDFVENGFCEELGSDIIAMSCKTAREGVELFKKIIEEKGNAEANIYMIADQNEAWYIEAYSGHQFVAIKMPTDKVAVFGNEFMLQTEYNQDDPDSFICSEDLFSLPQKAGLAVMDGDKMSICETYSGKDRLADYANYRTYIGHYRFAPSTAGKYETKNRYDLFYNPDTKIGLNNVFEIFRDRFEGTGFSPDEDKNEKARVIGTETQSTVHAVQVFDNVPKELDTVSWICLANAEHSVFLPHSNFISKVANNCKDSSQVLEIDTNNNLVSVVPEGDTSSTLGGMSEQEYADNMYDYKYNESLAHIMYKKVCTLAESDRILIGRSVRDFWKEKELNLIKEYPDVYKKMCDLYAKSPKEAQKFIDDYTLNLEEESMAQANSLFDEILMYCSKNVDSLKYKFSYDTLTYSDNKTPVSAFEPKMTYYNYYNSLLKSINDRIYPQDDFSFVKWIVIGVAIIVILLVIVFIYRRRKKFSKNKK